MTSRHKAEVTQGKIHDELYAQIGLQIRQARQKIVGLTQEKLAKRVGLTRTSITNIEQGRQKLLVHTLADLARELDVPMARLLPSKPLSKKLEDKLPKSFSYEERDFVTAVVGIPKRS